MENSNIQGNNQEKANFNNKFTHEEELGSLGDMMTNLNIVEKTTNPNQGNYVTIKLLYF